MDATPGIAGRVSPIRQRVVEATRIGVIPRQVAVELGDSQTYCLSFTHQPHYPAGWCGFFVILIGQAGEAHPPSIFSTLVGSSFQLCYPYERT